MYSIAGSTTPDNYLVFLDTKNRHILYDCFNFAPSVKQETLITHVRLKMSEMISSSSNCDPKRYIVFCLVIAHRTDSRLGCTLETIYPTDSKKRIDTRYPTEF